MKTRRAAAPVALLPFPKHTQAEAEIRHEDVLRFLDGLPESSIDLIVTDPAYSGMNRHLMLGKGRIVGKYSERGKENSKWFKEFEDTPENYARFLEACFRALKPNRHMFIMFDSYSLLTLGPILRTYFDVKNILVWDKVNFGMGHYFRRQTEFIVFVSKGKRPLSRRDIPDLWPIKRLHRAPYPTQKPVELFEAMIASSKARSDKAFVVCDPFAGSGSAAIAALRQNASFVGCDSSAEAVALAKERIEEFTASGKDPHQPKSAHDPKLGKKFW